MKKLNLDRKDLFNVKVQDTIDENDLFYEDVMKPAATQLKIILENCYVSPETPIQYDRKENPNNILAFIGDRGQGKTSTMLTFEKQLMKCEEGLFGENIKNYHFESLGIIDPSTFEEGSNVLEIILGRMYRFFVDKDEEQFSSGNAQKNIKEKRKNLIDLFKKAYNYLSVLSDKKSISKDSIYEQSLDNLLLLGDSTSLKMILLELINKYLSFMNHKHIEKKNVLIITIDDLDLDISHSYEIIEQIRKYLILPNVIILLSTKIEQLHRGIRREYLKYLGNNEDDIEDAYKMATTYLRKMIPESRRLFLPNLRSDVEDLYINKEIMGDSKHEHYSLNDYAIELIHKKTGIYLINYGNRNRYLLSGNLREYLELISFLSNLEDATGLRPESSEVVLKNLIKFREFFVFNWCFTNLSNKEFNCIQEIEKYNLYLKNRKVISLFRNILSENSLANDNDISHMFKRKGTEDIRYSIADVQKTLKILRSNDYRIRVKNTDKFIYSFQLYYTILLNQLKMIDNILETDNTVVVSAREINYVSKELGGKIKEYTIKIPDEKNKNYKGFTIFPVFFACEAKKRSKKEWENKYLLMLFIILLVKRVDVNRDMVLYSYEGWFNLPFMIDFNDIYFRGLDIKYSTKLLYELTEDLIDTNSNFVQKFEQSKAYLRYAPVIQRVSEFILCNYDVYNFYYDRKMRMNTDNFQELLKECIGNNKAFLESLLENTKNYFNLEMMQDIKNDINEYINFLKEVRIVVDSDEDFKDVNVEDVVLNIY